MDSFVLLSRILRVRKMDSYQRSWFHFECTPCDSHIDRSLADSGKSCLSHRSPGCLYTHSHPGHTCLLSNQTDKHTLLQSHTCPHLLHSYTPEHSCRHNLVIRTLKQFAKFCNVTCICTCGVISLQ